MRCGIDFGTSNTTMAVVYQDSSILIPTTVGLRALAFKPDGSNQLVAFAADTNATQVLEFYEFLGGWD